MLGPDIEFIKNNVFRLKTNYLATLYPGLDIVIPVMLPDGSLFETDLASVPKVLRVLYDRTTFGLRPPVIHDYLCTTKGKAHSLQMGFIKLNSKDVHRLFYDTMRQSGIPRTDAARAYLAVRLCGPKWKYPDAHTLNQLKNFAGQNIT